MSRRVFGGVLIERTYGSWRRGRRKCRLTRMWHWRLWRNLAWRCRKMCGGGTSCEPKIKCRQYHQKRYFLSSQKNRVSPGTIYLWCSRLLTTHGAESLIPHHYIYPHTLLLWPKLRKFSSFYLHDFYKFNHSCKSNKEMAEGCIEETELMIVTAQTRKWSLTFYRWRHK